LKIFLIKIFKYVEYIFILLNVIYLKIIIKIKIIFEHIYIFIEKKFTLLIRIEKKYIHINKIKNIHTIIDLI